MKKVLVILIFSCLFWGCEGIGGGTHGSIKSYTFPVKKEVLQKKVEKVISNCSNIHRDSIKYNIVIVDGGEKDTLWDNYYNDGINYISISIIEKGLPYTYTFHFYGGKEYWDTSKSSAISIAYAHNKEGEGGSEGNGGVKWYDFQLKKELTEPFEREFIDKIDKELGVKHTEEE